MTHYIFAEKTMRKADRKQQWETFAAFVTFGALVGLTGAMYGSFMRADVYAEVASEDELSRFAGMLDSSENLDDELRDKSRQFTLIAPSNQAFAKYPLAFMSDDGRVDDRRLIEVDGRSYMLNGESYMMRIQVMPQDVPIERTLEIPTANGEPIRMTRKEMPGGTTLMVNGVPVREQILGDNGVIYVVDNLISPLPSETHALAQ